MKDLCGYNAAQEKAGWRPLSRGILQVTGSDWLSFLHAMVSNDIASLKTLQGTYAAFLTATGKILADFDVYRFEGSAWIVVSRELCGFLKEKLEDFIIMEDVVLTDLSDQFEHVSLHGPDSADIVSQLLPALPVEVFDIVEGRLGGGTLLCVNRPEVATRGYGLIYPGQARALVQERWFESAWKGKLEPITEEAWEVLRVEAGIPRFGVDFSEQNNPIEARLSAAYSLTKGCYPGQEVLAKATHIGGVARLLSRLRIQGTQVPELGASVFSDRGKEIGWLTSSVWSPKAGGPIALGYLKRAFAVAGRSCRVSLPGEASAEASVVEDI